jgi:hypothetical protein
MFRRKRIYFLAKVLKEKLGHVEENFLPTFTSFSKKKCAIVILGNHIFWREIQISIENIFAAMN